MARAEEEARVTVGEHVVEVRDANGTDRLFIDEVPMAYHVTPAGFTVQRARYAEPEATLLEAGTKYAEFLIEIEKGTGG